MHDVLIFSSHLLKYLGVRCQEVLETSRWERNEVRERKERKGIGEEQREWEWEERGEDKKVSAKC